MTMHRWTMAALLALAVSAPAHAGPDEDAIRGLADRIAQAWREGDAAFLDSVFDARYIHTNTRGLVTDRAFDLDEVRRRDPHFDTYTHSDVDVIVHGDSAIASGRTAVAGRYGDTPFALDLRFTDTFVRRDGVWRLAATHVTPLPAPRR